MRITFAPSRLPVGAPSAPTAGRAGFAAALHVEPGARPCSGQAVATATLLGMQEERPDHRRAPRRRAAETAAAGLEGLSSLQRALLGGATVSLAELERAAQEAEAHAQDADDLGTRLCLSVALRLRVEIAKRERDDG